MVGMKFALPGITTNHGATASTDLGIRMKWKRNTMTKRQKKTQTQKLADKAKALGIDLSDVDIPTRPIDTEDDTALEAEAVLLYFDLRGKGFEHQICPECGKEFAYKYKVPMRDMRCSNRCRKKGLEARGIVWTPGKPLEARWARGSYKGTIPLIVPPEALSALRETQTED